MRKLQRADIDAAVAALGTAFFEDSLVVRLCPEESYRLYRTEPVFRFSANMAVGYGEGWADDAPQAPRNGDACDVATSLEVPQHIHRPLSRLTPVSCGNDRECSYGGEAAIPHSLRAVALWQYSWRMGCPFWRWIQYGALDIRRRLGAQAYGELTRVSARIDSMRERVAPERYLYLSSLGVVPERRREGLARALVQPRVHEAAAQGLSSIVETNTDGSLAFYKAVGFLVRAQFSISGLQYSVLEYPASPSPRTR